MQQPSEAYASGYERVATFARGLDEDRLNKIVPACPEWTVKELVAHLTGVASDSLSANVAEMGQANWTQSQVDSRKDNSLEEILEEWRGITDQITPALDSLHPTLSSALIGDLVTHEHDLRNAVGDVAARDTDGVVISTGFYSMYFGKRLKDAGLPTLIVETGEHRWTAGREEPAGTVTAPLFEMLRGLTGRRTTDEVKAFDWSVDAAPYLPLFSMYPPAQHPLNE